MPRMNQMLQQIRAMKARLGLSGSTSPFGMSVPTSRPKLPPESMLHYWHPERFGVQPCPEGFRVMLHRTFPDLVDQLRITRPPANAPIPTGGRWCVWMRNPRITFWACPGWQLIFIWAHPETGAELPLNELLLHNLFAADRTKYENARAYFERIEADILRQRASREADYHDERKGRQREWRDAQRISNHGSGSKFARHHDGTVAPSLGHEAMMNETRRWRLPGEVTQRLKDEEEQRRAG